MQLNSDTSAFSLPHTLIAVIPAYNEAGTVGKIVKAVLDIPGCDAVVVNDDSTDSTADEARAAGAQVLTLPWQLGAWGAMQAGLRHALAAGYRYAVTIDADGQHSPEDIPTLAEPVMRGTADVAIGSCTGRGSRARHLAWSLFRAISNLELSDLTSGFRAYNFAAMELLASREATLLDYQDIGVLLLLRREGLRIVERQVEMCSRKEGHSRIFHTWASVFFYMALTGVLTLSKTGKNRPVGN